MADVTMLSCYLDTEKAEALFKAREEEIDRLKKEMDANMAGNSETDLLWVLKFEMVQLMERDVTLWQQLKALDTGITALRHDMITTRSRSNTFSSVTESDHGIHEGEGQPEVRSKPRSHTVTSLEGFGNFQEDIRPNLERKDNPVSSQVLSDSDMRDFNESLDTTKDKYGVFGMFSAFAFRSGLFESGMSRYRNNAFSGSLKRNIMDLVEDLIKPSHNNLVLPRRRLHRQCHVFEIDGVSNNTNDPKCENIETGTNEIKTEVNLNLQNNISEDVQSNKDTCEITSAGNCVDDLTDKSYIERDTPRTVLTQFTGDEVSANVTETQTKDNAFDTNGFLDANNNADVEHDDTLKPQDDTLLVSTDTNEAIIVRSEDSVKHMAFNVTSNNYIQTHTCVDDADESDKDDTEFTYLVLNDGFVSCRIMSPGLEQQIKLKHETEGEPLDYLKYESGFARFISGSDTDSYCSRDSYQSDIDYNSECDESDDDTLSEICNDIKHLFDIDQTDDFSSLSAEESDEEHDGSVSTLCENDTEETSEIKALPCQDISTVTQSVPLDSYEGSTNVSNDQIRTDPVPYLGTECLKIVDDTKSVISKELISDDYGLCLYKEKMCSFTFKISNRISSVDSGIGDEMVESFDNLD